MRSSKPGLRLKMGQHPLRAQPAWRQASPKLGARIVPLQGKPTIRRRVRASNALTEARFSYIAAASDFIAVLAAAASANALYALGNLGLLPDVESVAGVGVAVGALVVLSSFQRGEYSLKKYSTLSGQFARIFPLWNLAFLGALVLGFATKTTGEYSRAATAVFYLSGVLAVAGTRVLIAAMVSSLRARGNLPLRRLFVVGFEHQSRQFMSRYDLGQSGMEIVSAFALRNGDKTLSDDLVLAAAAARILRPDDIFLAVPWSHTDVIESCVDAFARTPSEIHLSPENILDRYQDARIANLGEFSSLSLTRSPLSALQRVEKRCLDIVIGVIALILLAPLFAAVALLIKLDGPGPVFFRQTRYGFNQQPFCILKFRTMKVMENDRAVRAAIRNDPRVTRIGALLRRFSIDELPQIANVLAGDMSLVGPRPHALSHDQQFERKIARCARRHNVKPGITGWAQVRGYRGEILSDEALAGRIDHDLYYIDNWSLWLDFKILALTIFSARSRSNAY